VVPLDGSPVRGLERFTGNSMLEAAAFSPSGRRVASAVSYGDGQKVLRVWDLDTGEMHAFELPGVDEASSSSGEPPATQTGYERGVDSAHFVGEDRLYTGGDGGIRRWDIASGRHELVVPAGPGEGLVMRMDAAGTRAVVKPWKLAASMACGGALGLVELGSGTSRDLTEFGDCPHSYDLDGSGTIVATGDWEGVVRVGRLGDPEPHLLLGHEGAVRRIALSPDLRWVASAGEDNTLRLWPMPDLDKPPLHTLPREELLAKLRSLTNLRAVRDAAAPNGWTIELGPFPGWKEVPTW
jgi:WD40 repeat protein